MPRNARIPRIGMFGTCGGSHWRDPFIKVYKPRKIKYFNPQVDNWSREMAKIEAQHLKSDEIILFPVTSETYGLGSLAESGFSIIQALQNPMGRDFIVMIAQDLDEHLQVSPLYEESLRARELVREHLQVLDLPNLYVVEELDEMLDLSLRLHDLRILRLQDDKVRSELRSFHKAS